MDRRFDAKQHTALFLAADGKCSNCGAQLEAGWHADHVTPYSKGGETNVINGQALCAKCNLKKGNRITVDQVTLRPFQKRFVEIGLERILNGDKVLVANVHPGSGKTLASQTLLNELARRGFIDSAAIFVPRLNLCEQFELDWKEIKRNYAEPRMGDLEHRHNALPLLGRHPNQFGYVTTYDSLTDDLEIHLHEFSKHRGRIALVLDEASQLGMREGLDVGGTQSARAVMQLYEMARFTIVMTGTFYRADGLPILPELVEYSTPDENGQRVLQAHVDATYTEGTREHYLRHFEFLAKDARAVREYLDRSQVEKISDQDSGFSDILMHGDFWHPMVDHTIQTIREQQKIHPYLCGLISAARQSHAKAIRKYIEDKHPSVRVLLAVSEDGSKAHEALSDFKERNDGKYDILITVGMAYIGYDYKPITVVCCLNAIRQEGWLRQLFARGMRVMKELPYEAQTLIAIVPDDRRMQEFCERLRTESRQGIREREQRDGGDILDRKQPELSFISNVDNITTRAFGHEPGADVDVHEYPLWEEVRQKNMPQTPLTNFRQAVADILGKVGHHPQAQTTDTAGTNQRPTRTTDKWEGQLSKELDELCSQCDAERGAPGKVRWGFTHDLRVRAFGKKVKYCNVEELKEQIEWAKSDLKKLKKRNDYQNNL